MTPGDNDIAIAKTHKEIMDWLREHEEEEIAALFFIGARYVDDPRATKERPVSSIELISAGDEYAADFLTGMRAVAQVLIAEALGEITAVAGLYKARLARLVSDV